MCSLCNQHNNNKIKIKILNNFKANNDKSRRTMIKQNILIIFYGSISYIYIYICVD